MLLLASVFLGCASHAGTASRSSPPPGPACASSLLEALPPTSRNRLFVRPAAIFLDPRLGPLLSRSFDEAAERALIRRAERTGYDVRAVERAAVAWQADGAVYLAAGSFDVNTVTDRLWDRLLPPRRRGRDPIGDERVEGTLGDANVALLVVPACHQAGYAEATLTRSLDRLVEATPGHDPDLLLEWSTEQVPGELVRSAGAPLMAQVQRLDLRVNTSDAGLDVTLRLDGPLDERAPARIQQAIAALQTSPLGELADARSWLANPAIRFDPHEHRVELQALVPWRALTALADAMRGDVGGPSFR